MSRVRYDDAILSIPEPLYLVIEDVGWWRGEDGSPKGQPFRNRFCRDHCIADYEALCALSERLSMKIGIAMVLCEWDRDGCLGNVPGAIWPGKPDVHNSIHLMEVAEYLNEHRSQLEIALHGLCHEFWQNGTMLRSEFHDASGAMRSPQLVRAHLDAFATLLNENSLGEFPELFVPPALNHSFGDGPDSMQSILHEYGIRFIITRFARARQFSPPIHHGITWEEGVIILERGEAPVPWSSVAASPPLQLAGPVVALHWGNLLHPDPQKNLDIITAWADAVLATAHATKAIIARDAASCVRQCAAHYLGEITVSGNGIHIDLDKLPHYNSVSGAIWLRIEDSRERIWHCAGAKIVQRIQAEHEVQLIEVIPHTPKRQLRVYCQEISGR